MAIKYAIRMCKFFGGKPSGKADGMYIRVKDHLMTDHPPNAQLFDTVNGLRTSLSSGGRLPPCRCLRVPSSTSSRWRLVRFSSAK